ncbi:MAG: TetR/AcrR family transcriptional regulator [Thermodesulfovibrio sp.]|nr:TetR/AcrR family transcriptional regulator [Thermodesulfovibrio sp.]
MQTNTRNKILDAGLKLFSTKGYLGATTKEIARVAGVAELTLFRHFSSKERLFEEVLKHDSFLPVLRELLPAVSGLSYEDALMRIARKLLLALKRRKGLIRIMHTEISRYPEQILGIYHSFIDEMVNTLAAYFDGLVKTGALREFDTALGARAFFGMFYSYFNNQEFLMLRKYQAPDKDRVVREYVRIFARGTISSVPEKRRLH